MNSMLLNLTYVFFFIGMVLLICVVCYYAKRQKGFETFYQQELLHARLEIQEQTIKRAAQDIHDNIGQMLSLAKLNLNRLDRFDPTRDDQMLDESKILISRSIKDLRTLSKILSADHIYNLGLLRAMEAELQLVQNAGTKTVNLKVEGTAERLDTQKELILFRIFQESIQFFIKQSGSSPIQVKVNYSPKSFELFMVDQSIEFTPAMRNSQINDWQIINTRAKLIGASFEITSTAEAGTSFYIYLPLIN
jgi:signal transduction histidine kinase